MKQRRLSDLYVRGKEVKVDDGAGEPVTVWLAKPSSIDSEAIRRRSQAAKARFQIDGDDEDNEEFQAAYASIRGFADRDQCVNILIGDDALRARERIEAQLSTDEESWGREGFLQGLFDAWVGTDEEPGLAKTAAEDPDDPEVKRVKAELDRFEADVFKELDAAIEDLRAQWADVGLDDLWRKTAHEMLKRRADDIYVREFRRQELFYSVRQIEDHSKRYFGTLAEIDDLDEVVVSQLTLALNTLVVDVIQGKDSPPTPDSSNSSEPPAETSQPSGLEVVVA